MSIWICEAGLTQNIEHPQAVTTKAGINQAYFGTIYFFRGPYPEGLNR
jgi:hypothetical protein